MLTRKGPCCPRWKKIRIIRSKRLKVKHPPKPAENVTVMLLLHKYLFVVVAIVVAAAVVNNHIRKSLTCALVRNVTSRIVNLERRSPGFIECNHWVP